MDHLFGIPPRYLYMDLVRRAILEDLEHGDITTDITVESGRSGHAVILAKEECVVAGSFVVQEVFRQIDASIKAVPLRSEGAMANAGDILIDLKGDLYTILQGERVALNFFQRTCGVATLTRKFIERVEGTGCRIVDTRKTTPGLRLLQKYAVRAGGGANHRYGLSDGILIKDNHIAACGSVTEAMNRARIRAPHTLKVEIEVTTVDGLKEAIKAGADAVLLDNMEVTVLEKAVETARRIGPGVMLEASGGIHLGNVREVAGTGVDIISIGALTHSASASDLSLEVTI